VKKPGPFLLGLTGSIGMGKTTTAGFFRQAGFPVWDADSAVHRLYSKGGAAVEGIREIHPDAIRDGAVSREVLRDWISRDSSAIRQIEAVVHPLVARDRAGFIADASKSGAEIVVLDIPLLFETGGDKDMDAVLVVSAPPDVQKSRVLARDGMTGAHFNKILAAQMPDSEKRQRADYVIESTSITEAQKAVDGLLKRIRKNA
jgi:dephospho-CoA kinase